MKRIPILIVASLFLISVLNSCDRLSDEKKLVLTGNMKLSRGSSLEKVNTSMPGNLVFTPLIYKSSYPPVVHKVLIEDYRLLPGGREMEVTLKDGIRFHDGTPLTSISLVRSIDLLKREFNRLSLHDIDAEAIDRLRLRLKKPTPISDPEKLLMNIEPISPSPINPFIGTGPYRFKRWLRDGLELEVNPDYHEGIPNIDRVIYIYEPDERAELALLLKGDVDLVSPLPPRVAAYLRKDEKFQVFAYPTGLNNTLYFNMRSPLLKDVRVRRAISLAIDRDVIIKKGLYGEGERISTPFPAELLPAGLIMNSQRFDPKEGARLLGEAGWMERDKDGILEKGGKELILTAIYSRDSEDQRKVMDIISHSLFEVGVGLNIVAISEERSGGAVLPDYDMILDDSFYSEGAIFSKWISSSSADLKGNLSGFRNSEVDRLLHEMNRTSSADIKRELNGKVAAIFDREVPAVFLYYPVIYSAVSSRFKVPYAFGFDIYSYHRIKDWEVR